MNELYSHEDAVEQEKAYYNDKSLFQILRTAKKIADNLPENQDEIRDYLDSIYRDGFFKITMDLGQVALCITYLEISINSGMSINAGNMEVAIQNLGLLGILLYVLLVMKFFSHGAKSEVDESVKRLRNTMNKIDSLGLFAIYDIDDFKNIDFN